MKIDIYMPENVEVLGILYYISGKYPDAHVNVISVLECINHPHFVLTFEQIDFGVQTSDSRTITEGSIAFSHVDSMDLSAKFTAKVKGRGQ